MTSELSKSIKEYTEKYEKLEVFGKKVRTPYFNNSLFIEIKSLLNNGIFYKHFRNDLWLKFRKNTFKFGHFGGKGKPEELVLSLEDLCLRSNIKIEGITSSEIENAMRFFGLGVDCSGFVFNVLNHTFNKNIKEGFLEKNLRLDSKYYVKGILRKEKLDRFNTSVKMFYSDFNSHTIAFEDLSPADLIITNKNKDWHIKLVQEIDNGNLVLCESNLLSGVRTYKVSKELFQKSLNASQYIRRLNFI